MNIVDDILAQYKDLIGQFFQTDAALVRIRNRIASNRAAYGMYQQQHDDYRAEYDLLDKTLNAILDRVTLLRMGRGAEVRISEIINGLFNFASRCERLVKNVGALEEKLFGNTRLVGMRAPMLGLLPLAGLAFVIGTLVAGGKKK